MDYQNCLLPIADIRFFLFCKWCSKHIAVMNHNEFYNSKMYFKNRFLCPFLVCFLYIRLVTKVMACICNRTRRIRVFHWNTNN